MTDIVVWFSVYIQKVNGKVIWMVSVTNACLG